MLVKAKPATEPNESLEPKPPRWKEELARLSAAERRNLLPVVAKARDNLDTLPLDDANWNQLTVRYGISLPALKTLRYLPSGDAGTDLGKMILDAARDELHALRDTVHAALPRTRRRLYPRAPRPLTSKELEAYELVSAHDGNITKAATVAGKSKQVMQRSWKRALRKLRAAGVNKPRIQGLPNDRRGQVNVANPTPPDVDD